jgi:hypothetical protein
MTTRTALGKVWGLCLVQLTKPAAGVDMTTRTALGRVWGLCLVQLTKPAAGVDMTTRTALGTRPSLLLPVTPVVVN